MFGIQIFLEHVAGVLQIDLRELVFAYIIVESLVRKDRRLLQNSTVRLVFVAAVSLVMKLVIDAVWLTTNTFRICSSNGVEAARNLGLLPAGRRTQHSRLLHHLHRGANGRGRRGHDPGTGGTIVRDQCERHDVRGFQGELNDSVSVFS